MGEDAEEYCRNLIPDENFEEQLYECQNELENLQAEYDAVCNELGDTKQAYDDLRDEIYEANEEIERLQRIIDDMDANEY